MITGNKSTVPDNGRRHSVNPIYQITIVARSITVPIGQLTRTTMHSGTDPAGHRHMLKGERQCDQRLVHLAIAISVRQLKHPQRVVTHQQLLGVVSKPKLVDFLYRPFRVNNRPIGTKQNFFLAVAIRVMNE